MLAFEIALLNAFEVLIPSTNKMRFLTEAGFYTTVKRLPTPSQLSLKEGRRTCYTKAPSALTHRKQKAPWLSGGQLFPNSTLSETGVLFL